MKVACSVWSSPQKGHRAEEELWGWGAGVDSQGQAAPPPPSPTPGFRFQKGLDRPPPLGRAAKSIPLSPATALIQPLVPLPGTPLDHVQTHPTWGFGNLVAGTRVREVGFPCRQGL